MNKAELVEALEVRLGNRKTATDAVEAVIDTIVRSVAKGERVAISGFGTFERVARAARTGRNPRTGTPVKIKKTTVPKFKPGTAFKTYVAAPRSMPSVANSGGVAVTSRGLGAAAATVAKKAPAKKSVGAATAAKKATATKAPATKTTASKTTAAKAAASKTTATKAVPARKTVTKTAAAPAPARKTVSRATTAKATPAKTATKRTAKKA